MTHRDNFPRTAERPKGSAVRVFAMRSVALGTGTGKLPPEGEPGQASFRQGLNRGGN